jgi:plasmid stabilization system protein ParE
LARLTYSRRAFEDLEQVTDFLLETDPTAALETIDLIEEAVSLLERHPCLGRPIESGLRELVISRGRTGYLALYDLDDVHEVVRILAIRHQGESGYIDVSASQDVGVQPNHGLSRLANGQCRYLHAGPAGILLRRDPEIVRAGGDGPPQG